MEDELNVYDPDVLAGARQFSSFQESEESKTNSLVMRVYADNRRTAQQQHTAMTQSHVSLPQYNQPSDLSQLQEIRAK